MTIRAVIFDMDGVLIDAKEWHYEALNRALALFGHEITHSEHLAGFDGLPTMKKLQRLTDERGFPASLHQFTNAMKQQYTLEIVEECCAPRTNHEYALSRLKREGYTLGVASNSVRKSVERMMELSGLDRHLSFMLSNQDVKNAKPSPDIYLAAAARARVSPTECVVVEDNPHGIEAATLAGANVLAVETVDDVTYDNIMAFIQKLEAAQPAVARRRAA